MPRKNKKHFNADKNVDYAKLSVLKKHGFTRCLGRRPKISRRDFVSTRDESVEKRNFFNALKFKGRSINDFIKLCYATAKAKGWWDKERSDGELIALMHSELSEALEAMRNNMGKDAISEELADCCIRIFDYCGRNNIDLEEALLKKAEKNKTRPYRHGKVF